MKQSKTTYDRFVPAEQKRVEISVLNSTFISTVTYTPTTEEARRFINQIKQEFRSASHNVPAFIIGHGSSVTEHCHDDGEPSGTAGNPVLTVLRGSGFGDITIVATRYFGGTKLGKGGLVRAYTESAKSVLDDLRKAIKTETQTTALATPYSYYERIINLINEWNGLIEDENFTDIVSLKLRFQEIKLAGFQAALINITNGQITVQKISAPETTVVPYDNN